MKTFCVLMLLDGQQEGHSAYKKTCCDNPKRCSLADPTYPGVTPEMKAG